MEGDTNTPGHMEARQKLAELKAGMNPTSRDETPFRSVMARPRILPFLREGRIKLASLETCRPIRSCPKTAADIQRQAAVVERDPTQNLGLFMSPVRRAQLYVRLPSMAMTMPSMSDGHLSMEESCNIFPHSNRVLSYTSAQGTAASRGSRCAASSMGVAGEAAGDVADAERLGTGRLNFDLVQERRGTAASRRSMGTRGSDFRAFDDCDAHAQKSRKTCPLDVEKKLQGCRRAIISSWSSGDPTVNWSMNLSELRLSRCPDFVFQRENLRVLQLSGNSICDMPPDIVRMQHLHVLKLDGNQLRGLPLHLRFLCHLQILDVSGNPISLLDIDALPPSLMQATFANNMLKCLPNADWHVALPNLEFLDLTGNLIEQIEATIMASILSISTLRSLNLSSNKFAEKSLDLQPSHLQRIRANLLLASETTSAEDFKHFVDSLQNGMLDASRGDLPSDRIPRDFLARVVTSHAARALRHSGIRCLDVRSNLNLSRLPAQELCSISTLQRIECAGCHNLLSLPPEMSEDGALAMQFLREYVEDGTVNDSVALFLIGEGESGKTSLMRALMNEVDNTAARIGKDTRTVGMDMVDWHTKDSEGNELIVKIKDFGGQSVYIRIHELFVLHRAVYLYLWRADKEVDEVINACKRWLNLLQSCVPGVAIVPVVTHKDLVDDIDLQRKCKSVQLALMEWQNRQASFAKSEDARIVRVLEDGRSHAVNCLNGEAITELRVLLMRVVATTRGYRELLPKSWKELRDIIRKKGQTTKYFTWVEYRRLCMQCGIKNHMVLPVTSFLHETSEMRYFGIYSLRKANENLEDFLTSSLSNEHPLSAKEAEDAVHKITFKLTEIRPGWRSEMPTGMWEAMTWLERYQYLETIGMVDNSRRGLGDDTDARAIFDDIDLDGSGAIDKDELRRFMLRKLGQGGVDKVNLDAFMQSADEDRSGQIDFEEFYKSFYNARENRMAQTVYLASEWMIDVLKGIIRHDHAALCQHFEEENRMGLVHQTRRLRVHGVISEDLLAGNYLWPGTPSPYWSKVAEVDSYKFEKQLWDDGEGALKKVVENEHDMAVALDLLVGFKIIIAAGSGNSSWFCPDLVPAHKKDTTGGRCFDVLSCPYWHDRTYAEIPFGFWNLVFMETREHASSGSTSTHVHTFFVLSATVQIIQTQADDGKFTLRIRASTRSALDMAVNSLGKAHKFYPGLELWCLSRKEIDERESNSIVEEAQLLIMTAGRLVQKKDLVIEDFNRKILGLAKDVKDVENFLPKEVSCIVRPDLQHAASFDQNSRMILKYFSTVLDRAELLRLRMTDKGADHSTGAISLASISRPDKWMREISHEISRPLGLQWMKTTVDEDGKPVQGMELKHDQLAQILKDRGPEIRFERFEWKQLGISELSPKHFITCSGFWFTPAPISKDVPRHNFGLKWVANATKPFTSTQELLHAELLKVFKFKMEEQTGSWILTQQEWNELNISDLCLNHWIKSGDSYFSPAPRSVVMPPAWKIFSKQIMLISDSFPFAFANPTSKILLLPDEETLNESDQAEWISTFFREVDNHFSKFGAVSKEIFTPNRFYNGKAQVLLVLLDEDTSRCPELCDRFAELEREGCQVIGVPMPGYQISDYSKWWPARMPAFRNHSLFFDCRREQAAEGNRWEGKMRRELMPQIQTFLEEWSERRTKPRVETAVEVPGETTPGAHRPTPGALQERRYESKEEMRESMLPCPRCLELGQANPGTFKRDDCMLYFASPDAMTNTKGTLYCDTCQNKVKVKEVLKRPIFLSYNWGNNNSTQKIAKPLCERVFLATEMPYWLDIDGGMGYGDELMSEMREGVENCKIVILMISDAFCNSINCHREFLHMVRSGKYIIPLLVPDHGLVNTNVGGQRSSGWTGAFVDGDEDWWKHAETICQKNEDPDEAGQKIDWSYLASFTPVDLRNEECKEDGSLQDDSAAENEIVRRVLSRFFR